MRVGNTLVINIDKITPDFVNEWTSREEGEFNGHLYLGKTITQKVEVEDGLDKCLRCK